MSFRPRFKQTRSGASAAAENTGIGRSSPDGDSGAPHLLVVHGMGPKSLARILADRLFRHREILVLLNDLPRRVGTMQKLVLSMADGVIAAPDLAGVLAQIGVSPGRIITSGQAFDHSEFGVCPPTRSGPDAYRIVFAGEFSPHSGAADFLSCAIGWAEAHPDQAIEILWLGSGDLHGILRAQLLPPNLTQVFAGLQSSAERVGLFARCGVLVVPSLSQVRVPCVAEAMAAGLPVLGSVHSVQVRSLVSDRISGWLFDPMMQDSMSAALETVLSTTPEALDTMRTAARSGIAALQADMLGQAAARSLHAGVAQILSQAGPARA